MRNSIIVTTHFFNNYLPQILLIFFFLSGQLDLGSKLFVGCGFILLITTTFSSNKRSIIFSKFTKNLFLETISVRIDISLVITLFLLVIYGFFDIFEFFYLIVFFSILIRWVNEIILSYFELTKIKYPNIFFLICDFVFYFILFSNLILDLEINIKFFLALLNILNIILISIQLWRIKFKKKNRTLKILLSDITNLSFLSSLSLSLSNQLWKILIFFFSGATLSGIYFTAFSLASFSSSFLNNQLATYFLKKKVNFLSFFISANLLILGFIFFIKVNYKIVNPNLTENENSLFLNILLISFIGTIFMIKSIRERHNLINLKYFYKVFYEDIKLYILTTFLVPFNYFIFGLESFKFLYLLSSLLSFVIYQRLKYKITND